MPLSFKLARLLMVIIFTSETITVSADPTDWVNPSYIVQLPQSAQRSTIANAQNMLLKFASSTAKQGPWSVTNSKGVLPPSQDPHDFLSFAPYHWPNCNWCSHGSTHLVNPGSNGNSTDDGNSDDGTPSNSDPFPDGGDDGSDEAKDEENFSVGTIDVDNFIDSIATNYTDAPRPTHTTAVEFRRAPGDVYGQDNIQKFINVDNDARTYTESWSDTWTAVSSVNSHEASGSPKLATANDSVPMHSTPPLPSFLTTSRTSTTQNIATGTPAPALAAGKTKAPKAGPKCTPSPTRSLAPTATWTTCPYIARDGRVNPDVRLLNAPAAINFAAQSILYNAVAYALQKTSAYSSAAVAFIDAFFLEPATKMNPNMNFGQVVRGPPPKGSQGTFTGVLDLRGIVKIINGVAILKAAESPDWTAARDEEMATWMSAYAGWLENSTLGTMSASRPNNHGTFYVSQLTSTRVLAGNVQGAADALQGYFSHQYLDQLAASGEQPFEAVRTRPFHYRCFNLEAMIVNAKIGDQLGLNLWMVKSRYGATIQTALDYTMKLNPKFEDVTEVLPHVASVAAAYGDPTGKYAAFLKKTMSDYQTKSFWLYDQTSALSSSPAAQSAKANAIATPNVGVPDSIPFQCPAVFGTLDRVQIDDDIYVTCEELKPFYEIAVPQDA